MCYLSFKNVPSQPRTGHKVKSQALFVYNTASRHPNGRTDADFPSKRHS
jgi:hypothetical protein